MINDAINERFAKLNRICKLDQIDRDQEVVVDGSAVGRGASGLIR